MSNRPLMMWIGVSCFVLVGTLVFLGCSEPKERVVVIDDSVKEAEAGAMMADEATIARRPDRIEIEPRELTEEELAVQEMFSEPNASFVTYGEMYDPASGVEELPLLQKTKNIKPGKHPPVVADLKTGRVQPTFEELGAPDDVPERVREELDSQMTARTPGIGVNFEGMSSSAVAPSDAECAVGLDTVVSAANRGNSGYRLHTKAGVTLATVNQTTFHGITCCCDARALWDPTSDRYFIMSLVNSCTPRVAIGMSKTGSPTNLSSGAGGTNQWFTWTISFPGSNEIPDFPQIGVDADAVYVTANMFNCSTGGFVGVKMLVIPKAQLLAGATTPVVSSFTNLTETWTGSNFQAFTVVPTVSHGDPGVGILADNGISGNVTDGTNSRSARFVTLWIVDDPAGTPSLSTFPAYVQASNANIINPRQSGTTVRLAGNGSDLHGMTYRDGSLWGAHTSRLVSSPVRDQVSWHEIDVFKALDPDTPFMGWEQGDFVSNTGRSYFFPNATVDRFGNAGLVMSGSSENEFAGAWYATRASDDAADSFQAPLVMKAGASAYTGGGSPSRWGDYGGISPDPVDGVSFWATSNWAKTASTFSTWIGQFTMSPQTTALPFFEDFESGGGGLGAGMWSLTSGTVDGVGVNEPSGTNSGHMSGLDRGQQQFRTRQIDLSGFSDVEVSFSTQRGGGGDAPEVEDRLSVDFINTSGNWENLEEILGTGASESSFTLSTHTLPASAYHEGFRLRFSTATSFIGDDFFVDDVSIRDCTASDLDLDGTGDACDTCVDADGDDYGRAGFDQSGCAQAGTDCDDNEFNANPGLAEEDASSNCADGIDNDCDGNTDATDPDCFVGPACTCGDINQSGGNVDLNDFLAFAGCLGVPPASSTECECSDLDGDDDVDLNDFLVFASLLNTSSTNTPPNCP